MFRKLLEFLGFSQKPAVDLPCSPCEESCHHPDDCYKVAEVEDVAEMKPAIVEPAIVEQFYRQDAPPTPRRVFSVDVGDMTKEEAEKAIKKVVAKKKTEKAPAKKSVAKKESKPAPAITAPKKKKTPAKKK